jgi:hypothetical protein
MTSDNRVGKFDPVTVSRTDAVKTGQKTLHNSPWIKGTVQKNLIVRGDCWFI